MDNPGINNLLQAIEAEATFTDDPERNFIYVDDVIDLINTHMAGKVIVPVEPTGWMIHEGLANFNPGQSPTGSICDAYKAMIAGDDQ